MTAIDHDLLRRMQTVGRIAAGRATLWALAQSGDLLSRFLQPGRWEDVYALYERMRASGRSTAAAPGHVVTSHDLCSQVLRDPRLRVRDLRNRPANFDPLTPAADGPDSFLEQDPPDHTRLRRLAAPAFRPKLIRGYRSQIETIAHDLLDRAARRGSFDLIEDFAAPLPITVITKLLGIPDVDVNRFTRIGAVIGQSIGGVFSVRQAENLRAVRDDLAALFIELERQRRHHPGDDVLSILTAAGADGTLSIDELVAPLARLEGEVALQTLAQRFPQLQVTGPLQRRPGSVIRGYASIPMTAPIIMTTP